LSIIQAVESLQVGDNCKKDQGRRQYIKNAAQHDNK